MSEVIFVLPQKSDDTDPMDFGLVTLTEAIGQLSPDTVAHGFLGGEFGYGASFENDVFEMRPYYWGDCTCGWENLEREWSDSHKHSDECYWAVSHRLIKSSPLQAEREAALDARDQNPFDPASQKKVDEVCERLDAYEESVRRQLCEQHGIPWDDGKGSAIHCTCGYEKEWEKFFSYHGGHKPTCAFELPNFRHKRTGIEVRWYKWIGRNMEVKGQGDLQEIFTECLESLKQ